MKEQRTTMGVSLKKKQKLQKAVLEVAKKTGTILKWTDVVNYMIDEYTEEACKDLIDKIKSGNVELNN